MRNLRTKTTLFAVLLPLLLAGTAQASADIRTVKFTPVASSDPFSIGPLPQRGNIQIVFADGKKQAVSGGRIYFTEYADANPQIAPDNKTAGWLRCTPINRKLYVPARLVIYRNHDIYRIIRGKLAYVDAFQFWNGGKQVAFRSRNGHGPSVIALYDLESGKVLSELTLTGYKLTPTGYKLTAALPAWAQKLKD